MLPGHGKIHLSYQLVAWAKIGLWVGNDILSSLLENIFLMAILIGANRERCRDHKTKNEITTSEQNHEQIRLLKTWANK
jgi:hypothetical protein